MYKYTYYYINGFYRRFQGITVTFYGNKFKGIGNTGVTNNNNNNNNNNNKNIYLIRTWNMCCRGRTEHFTMVLPK